MTRRRIRRPGPKLLERLKYAEPPPKIPRGYFDALVKPTTILLDKGLKLMQAADWLIREKALKASDRQRFCDAMCCRFTRARRKEEANPTSAEWRTSILYDSMHLLPKRGLVALCGVRSNRWNCTGEMREQCNRCKGIARKGNLSITGENQ